MLNDIALITYSAIQSAVLDGQPGLASEELMGVMSTLIASSPCFDGSSAFVSTCSQHTDSTTMPWKCKPPGLHEVMSALSLCLSK